MPSLFFDCGIDDIALDLTGLARNDGAMMSSSSLDGAFAPEEVGGETDGKKDDGS
jgi:hypothetical protein